MPVKVANIPKTGTLALVKVCQWVQIESQFNIFHIEFFEYAESS